MKERAVVARGWGPWRRVYPSLLEAVRSMGPMHRWAREEPEDLLHDVLVGVILKEVDAGRVSNPVGYVLRSVRRLAVSRWRRQLRSKEAALVVDVPASTHTHTHTHTHSLSLDEIAPFLAPREREVLVLWRAGAPIKQMARELSLDVRQVKRSLAKCAVRLKFGHSEETCPPPAS